MRALCVRVGVGARACMCVYVCVCVRVCMCVVRGECVCVRWYMFVHGGALSQPREGQHLVQL